MTPTPATLERIIIVLAVLAAAVDAAPMFSSSFDVELVDQPETDDVDDIIRSSMVTPFPAITPGQADEPNFFWSGSGDDPDAGMTYWITTTVYKTSVVTLTPTSPKTTPPTAVTVAIRPTPPITAPSPSVWPREAFEPRYWLRTVLRSSADERQPSFRQSIESNLRRMFADVLGRHSTTASGLHVLVRNVTRKEQDVELIYALSSWNAEEDHVMIEPYLAAGAARIAAGATNVTRELCRPQDGENALLCQSVVAQAEPFVRADEAVVAQVAETNRRYWIVGIVIGSLLVVLVAVALAFGFWRGRKRKKQDAAVGSPSATLVDTATQSKLSRQGSVVCKPVMASKSSQKSSDRLKDDIEDDPDPWVRKARSTSKKHSRSKQRRDGKLKRSSVRPQTAPEGRRPSASSLSAIMSGSSSGTSSAERLEYQLTSEEPMQASRGTRRIKNKMKNDVFAFGTSRRKKMLRSESLSTERTGAGDSPKRQAPVAKPRRLVGAVIETETQEITADFSDVTDKSDDEHDPAALPSTSGRLSKIDEVMWKPGSLIPTKISTAVFGPCRKVCSAPGYLQGGSTDRSESMPKRAWSSSDPIKSPVHSESKLYRAPAGTYQLSLFDPMPTVPGQQGDSPLRNPSLHVHSSSFPAWPAIGDTDPAIELIRSIKEELKKFDHQDR